MKAHLLAMLLPCNSLPALVAHFSKPHKHCWDGARLMHDGTLLNRTRMAMNLGERLGQVRAKRPQHHHLPRPG